MTDQSELTYKQAFKIYIGTTPSTEEERRKAMDFMRVIHNRIDGVDQKIFALYMNPTLSNEDIRKKRREILEEYEKKYGTKHSEI